MDPVTIYSAVRAAMDAGQKFKSADDEVAACAEDQGISKKEAWIGVRKEVRRRNDERLERLLDRADPKGWRAAARAMTDAEAGDPPS